MKRTEILQEIRRMRFKEVYGGWQGGRLSQEEAAEILGVCSRTFRRQICRFENENLEDVLDA
jgi:hypothetical protein